MVKKQTAHIIKGLQQDLSSSKQSSEYAIDAKNIRLTDREDPTLLSITNEKGTKELNSLKIKYEDSNVSIGTILGKAIIDDVVIFFSTNNDIYKDIISIYSKSQNTLYSIYVGNLNFTEHIDTLVSKESESILKIYWIDGVNFPRLLILTPTGLTNGCPYECTNTGKFDFNIKLNLQETIEVEKKYNGSFSPGVIQYTFSYYNNNGQETPLVDVTPLNYIALSDRGAAPDELVSNSFKVTIKNIDNNFDYIRLYSIHRSSINATPSVKLIENIELNKEKTEVSYEDTGDVGEFIDPTELLYKGGEPFIPKTFAQKDGTLFFGNIKTKKSSSSIQEDLLSILDNYIEIKDKYIKTLTLPNEGTYSYKYNNQLSGNIDDISTFKYLDWYRLGIQFQDAYGKWSDPLFLEDHQIKSPVQTNKINSTTVDLVGIQCYLDLSRIASKIKDLEYVRVRPLIVYPDVSDRDILCQGILCPTVFDLKRRISEDLTSQSSWFCRPNSPYDLDSIENPDDYAYYITTLGTTVGDPNTFEYTEDNTSAVSKMSIASNKQIHYFGAVEENNPITEDSLEGTYKIEDSYYLIDKSLFSGGPKVEDFSSLEFTIVKQNDEYYLTKFLGEDVAKYNDGGVKLSKDEDEINDVITLKIPAETTIKVFEDGSRYVLCGDSMYDDACISFDFTFSDVKLKLLPHQIYKIEERGGDIDEYRDNKYSRSNEHDFSKAVKSSYSFKQDFSKYGKFARFKHFDNLGYVKKSQDNYSLEDNSEIQGTYSKNIIGDTALITEDVTTPQYFIDQSIITMHSPDLEFDSFTSFENLKDYKLRLIGVVPITSNSTELDLKKVDGSGNVTTLRTINPVDKIYNLFKGLDTTKPKKGAYANMAWKGLVNGPWCYFEHTEPSRKQSMGGIVVYPWQISLGYKYKYIDKTLEIFKTYFNKAYKLIYNSKFSNNTYYLNDNLILESSDMAYWKKGHTSKLNLIPPKKFPYTTIKYSGDIIDYVLFGHADTNVPCIVMDKKIGGIEQNINNLLEEGDIRTSPVSEANNSIKMDYKSSNHIVISLQYVEENNKTYQMVLPTLGSINSVSKDLSDGEQYVWDTSASIRGVKQWGKIVNFKDWVDYNYSVSEALDYGWLWLGELYKDNSTNRFGGPYDSVDNLWYVAGKAVSIPSNYIVEDLCWTTGDTFYQRYDHVKTLPVATDKENSILDIISFMCETRVNIDGRWDKNRGIDNIWIQDNFNLYNDVYNQKNTFFNFRKIDKNISKNTNFNNTICWTQRKYSNSEIDPWTKLSMTSSLDLDFNKGNITKIINFNNELYCFQQNNISRILFNTRTQISTTDGVPVELGNSYKVDGFVNINSLGSSNPQGIVSTPKGVYYTNNNTKNIYVFDGQQSVSLSSSLGMSSWAKKQNLDSYKLYLDNNYEDLYFINNDTCLGYSEKIKQFESFYDYEDAEIFNVLEDTLAIKNGRLYKLFDGEYNDFFGKTKDFYVTITHNENPYNDKIYDSLEFRSDTYSNENILSGNSAFNTIRVYNEYQDTDDTHLDYNKYHSSNLKRKFRIWRASIPRDKSNNRDRIRNPWTNITLKAVNPRNTKTELHDLVVSYFM